MHNSLPISLAIIWGLSCSSPKMMGRLKKKWCGDEKVHHQFALYRTMGNNLNFLAMTMVQESPNFSSNHLLIFFPFLMTLRNCASKLIWKAEVVLHTPMLCPHSRREELEKPLEIVLLIMFPTLSPSTFKTKPLSFPKRTMASLWT